MAAEDGQIYSLVFPSFQQSLETSSSLSTMTLMYSLDMEQYECSGAPLEVRFRLSSCESRGSNSGCKGWVVVGTFALLSHPIGFQEWGRMEKGNVAEKQAEMPITKSMNKGRGTGKG